MTYENYLLNPLLLYDTYLLNPHRWRPTPASDALRLVCSEFDAAAPDLVGSLVRVHVEGQGLGMGMGMGLKLGMGLGQGGQEHYHSGRIVNRRLHACMEWEHLVQFKR
jgi:hypothetical protein